MVTRDRFSAFRAPALWRSGVCALAALAIGAGLTGAAAADEGTRAPGNNPPEIDSSAMPRDLVIGGLDLADATFTQVATGDWHGVGLAQDGTLWTWGSNDMGQLGDGTSASSSVPVRVEMTGALAGKQIEHVVSGLHHSAVLTTDGQVYTWGDNFYGQLGNGATEISRVPAPADTSGVLAGKTIVSLTASAYNTFVTASDGVSTWAYGWGRNYNGELGNETQQHSGVPVAVSNNGAMPSTENIRTIAARGSHTVALTDSGALYSWGNNLAGQLGDGSYSSTTRPVRVLDDSGDPTIQVAAGWQHTIALRASGAVYAWGSNNHGQLGTGAAASNSPRPTPVTTLAGQEVTGVSLGFAHSVATTADGRGFVWGHNEYGQLGNDDFASNVREPLALGSPGALEGETLTSITAGYSHNLGLTATGQVVGWGRGGWHLGNGTTDAAPVPRQLATHVVRFGAQQAMTADTRVDLSAGTITARQPEGAGAWADVVVDLTSAARTADLDAARDRTGAGQDGELVVSGLDLRDATFAQVSGSRDHSVGLAKDGTVWSWGDNARGQLGDGTTTSSAVPVQAEMTGALAGKRLAQVAAGREYTAALTTDGLVFTWGRNQFGQLGNGGGEDSTVPVPVDTSGVLAGKTITAITAGTNHVLAAVTDGDSTWVYGWGANASGQLGDDTVEDSPVPVPVSNDGALTPTENISAVAAGDGHSLTLTDTGDVYAWGANTSGQLGDGTHDSSTIPVRTVLPDTVGDPVVQITAGAQHAHVITHAGRVYGWGSNASGQVGTGQGADNPTPAVLTALNGQHVTTVSAGMDHTVATTADGRGFVWGSNEHGQLGNGDITGGIATPIALNHPGALDGQTIAGVQAGGDHNLALTTTGQVITWGRNTTGQLGNTTTTDAPTPVPGQLHTHTFQLGDDRIPATDTAVDLTAGTLTAHRPARGDRWEPLTITLANG